MNRILLLAVLAACGDQVSPPELGDYTSWYRVDTFGDVPGHGDSYRMIYVNDVARTKGTSERDAVLVKEVHDNVGDQPGGLRIIEIMRKIRPGTAPDGDGGWLFTQLQAPGDGEVQQDFCWGRCHVAAPYAGAWFDYTR